MCNTIIQRIKLWKTGNAVGFSQKFGLQKREPVYTTYISAARSLWTTSRDMLAQTEAAQRACDR